MIREHLRSNVVGYVGLFLFAMSGTAIALDGSDTVFSDDIVNGQVKTNDISNSNGVRSADVRDDTLDGGGLAPADLAPNSVGSSEIAAEGVTTLDIQQDGVVAADIGAGAVGSSEIATDAVGGSELAPNSVLSGEIASNTIVDVDLSGNSVGGDELKNDAVGGLELAPDSVSSQELADNAIDSSHLKSSVVGKDEIGADAVGGGELVDIHEHQSGLIDVVDINAHNGQWESDTGTVSCSAGEQMLGATIEWVDDQAHAETALKTIDYSRGSTDSATVTGIFDGGGGFNNPATFRAVATCIGA
jgi:hypothetical protein